MNEALEIEVKYMLIDIPALRSGIGKAGWISLGRHFEKNIRFEDRDHSLFEKKQLLRLRQDQQVTLTFKSKPMTDDPRFKILRELEVTVSDFETMQVILESLGFHEEQIYEKYRETFKAGDAVICVDEMPYGDFIEIEGPPETICSISEYLGFSPSRAITANYLEIFDHIRNKENLDFTDITFENFKALQRDFSSHIRMFEVANRALRP